MPRFFHKLFHSYKTKSVIFLAKSIAGSVQMGLRKLFAAESRNNEPVVIVTLANDGFAMMLAVTLKSLLHNYRQQSPVYVYIMDQQISEANKKKILQSVADPRLTVEWVPLDDDFFDRHRLRERYAHLPTTYYRFFLPLFVAERYKKIIWLDGDLVVRKDISALWNIPMDGNYALAVQDTRIPYIGDTIRNYAALGMAPGAQYFNAGVVVIDMEQWRAEDLSNKIMQCIEDNQKDLLYHDQYGLNVVLYKKWKSINPNWNIFPEFYPSLPYIIHYVSVKPTSTTYVNYNRQFFYRYLDMTVWKGWRPA